MPGRLDQETITAIRTAIAAELDARNRIDAETHAADHAWVQEMRQCNARRREIFLKVLTHVLGWSAALGAGWLGSVILNAMKASLKQQ